METAREGWRCEREGGGGDKEEWRWEGEGGECKGMGRSGDGKGVEIGVKDGNGRAGRPWVELGSGRRVEIAEGEG